MPALKLRLLAALFIALILATSLVHAKRTGTTEFLLDLFGEEEPDIVEQVTEFNNNSQYEEAIELGEQALSEDPENKDILLQLTYAYRNSDEYENGALYAQRTLKIDPDWTAPAIHLIACLRSLDKETEAIAFAEEWNEENKPVNASFHFEHAVALNFLDRDDEAHTFIKKALALSPNSTTIAGHYVYYTARFTSDRGAVRFIENFERKYGESRYLHENLGKGRNHAGRHEDAASALSKVLQLGSDDEDVADLLAQSLVELEQYDEAITKLENFIKDHGPNASITNRMGMVRYEENDYSKAYEFFEAARALNPKKSNYPSNALQSLIEDELESEALTYALKIIENPEQSLNRKCYERAANAAETAKDIDALTFVYDRALKQFPNDTSLAVEYLEDLRTLEDNERAIAWGVAWSKKTEVSSQFYTALGLSYRDIGDGENEIACDRQAYQLNPTDQQLLNNLMISLGDAELYREAVDIGIDGLAKLEEAPLPKLLNRIALQYDDLDENEKALTYFKQAQELDPTHPTWAGNVVYGYHNYESDDKALAFANHWLTGNEGNAYFFGEIADVHEDNENYTDEVKWRQLAYDIDPSKENKTNDLLTALSNAGLNDQAESLGQQALKDHPKSDSIWNRMGILSSKREDYEQAINRFEKAIELNESAPNYVGNLIDDLSNLERNMEAIKEGTTWLQRSDKPTAYFLSKLAYACNNEEQADQAIEYYKQALAITPTYESAAYNLGNILYSKDRYEEAEAVFVEYSKSNTPSGRIYNLHGVVEAVNDHYDKAEALYRKAHEILPDYSIYAGNLIFSLKQQRKYDEAKATVEKLLKSVEADAYFFKRCAQVYYSLNDYIPARDLFLKSHKLNPNNLDVHDHLVASYRLGDMHDQAIIECNKRIQNDQASAWIFTELGLAHALNDDTDKALAAYEKALEENPNYSSAAVEIFNIHKNADDSKKALSFIESWASEQTPSANLLNKWALLVRSNANYKEAASIFKRAHETAPANPSYIGNYVESLEMDEDYDTAYAAAEAYFETYGRKPYPLYRYGEALTDNYRYDDAISTLKESLSLQPDEVDHASELARAFYLKKDYEGGISFFENLDKQFEADATYHYWIGKCHLRAKKFEPASKSLTSASQLWPDSSFYHSWKMIGLIRDDKIEDALNEHLTFSKKNTSISTRQAPSVARVYQLTGDDKQARKILKAAIRACATDKDSTANFLRTCLELGMHDEITDVIEYRIRKSGKTAYNLIRLAISASYQDLHVKAEKLAREALELKPDYESAAYYLAHSLSKQSRPEEAQAFQASWQKQHGLNSRVQSVITDTL